MNTESIVIILGIILIIYFLYHMIYTYSEIKYVKSDLDGKIYLIRRGNNKSEKFLKDSANTLAAINKNVVELIDYLFKNYSNHHDKFYFIKKLKENYKPYIISEAAVDPRYTTYTIDKSDVHICLRTRDTNEKVYDMNILMYVVLHELAHFCNYNKNGEAILGHGSEFRFIFKFLVEQSIKIGIYNHVNYSAEPREYCGIMITTSII
jgi:hypothetical protein